MRKIIVTTFVTLDGVMQAPGGPQEDTTNGFKWGGWTAPFADDLTNKTIGAFMQRPFDLLLGRFTYDIFSAYWPYIKDNPIADKFNSIHKYIVSGSNIELGWQHSALITGDVVAGLRKLKEGDGPDLVVFGSRKLVQTLLANKLVDELHLWTYPITIGKGKRLFEEGTQPGSWKLLDSKTAATGVTMSSFVPDGEVKVGTVGPDNPSEAELARRERLAKEG